MYVFCQRNRVCCIKQKQYSFKSTQNQAINELPESKDLKQLQSFLGGINYSSKFIPNVAEIAKPVYRLLEKGTGQKWTKNEQLSFENLKQVLLTAPVLTIFDQNLPRKLDCNAS